MGRRARKKHPTDDTVYLAAASICMARCEAYADKMRAAQQDELAMIYEGFLMLLDEFCDDLRTGQRGQVLVDLA